MSETVPVIFRYAIEQIVAYDGGEWIIVARCYQEGTVSRFLTYGLIPEPPYGFTPPMLWAHEPDIEEAL